MARFWLRDDQFERIEALLPGKRNDPGRTAANNRLVVEAVLWIARTGSPWRDLPPEFGLWNSAYQRFARWSRQGVWHRIFAKMAGDADFVGGPSTIHFSLPAWRRGDTFWAGAAVLGLIGAVVL